MCRDSRREKRLVSRLCRNEKNILRARIFVRRSASQPGILIIRCFEIAVSLFLSRLDLVRKTKPGAPLQALRNPPTLLSLGQLSTICGWALIDATLPAAGASKGCWTLSVAGFHTPSNIVGTSLCKPELNFLIAIPLGSMSFTIVCTCRDLLRTARKMGEDMRCPFFHHHSSLKYNISDRCRNVK